VQVHVSLGQNTKQICFIYRPRLNMLSLYALCINMHTEYRTKTPQFLREEAQHHCMGGASFCLGVGA